jgi:hypothetical protein
MWYGAIPKGQLVLANFGASENYRLLLCLGVMQSRTWKIGKRGKSAHATWCLLAQCVSLLHFRLITYWLLFYQSDLFISILRSQIMRTCKKRSDWSNTCLDTLLREMRAVRNRGRWRRSAAKDFQIHFHILAVHCNRVRDAGVKSASPVLSLNTG